MGIFWCSQRTDVKYLEVEVDNENIIYPILVRIQEISFGAGVQAQLTGGTYL